MGVDSWCAPAAWYAYKYALDMQYIPLLCHSVANIIKSIFGKNKKGVVLDLDNTLWGGVIGDDGPEGVELGNETPTGMAYTAFQSYLKELSGMGVLLNVCSKNEEAAAKAGFERADSVLKADDFLCFKANWEPSPATSTPLPGRSISCPTAWYFWMITRRSGRSCGRSCPP